MNELPWKREAYEGTGGWNDGRLGQAYDLLHAVLTDRGQGSFRHPLLKQLETMDEEQAECPTCEGHGRLIRTIGNSTLCPYDDTIPCPDCQEAA